MYDAVPVRNVTYYLLTIYLLMNPDPHWWSNVRHGGNFDRAIIRAPFAYCSTEMPSRLGCMFVLMIPKLSTISSHCYSCEPFKNFNSVSSKSDNSRRSSDASFKTNSHCNFSDQFWAHHHKTKFFEVSSRIMYFISLDWLISIDCWVLTAQFTKIGFKRCLFDYLFYLIFTTWDQLTNAVKQLYLACFLFGISIGCLNRCAVTQMASICKKLRVVFCLSAGFQDPCFVQRTRQKDFYNALSITSFLLKSIRSSIWTMDYKLCINHFSTSNGSPTLSFNKCNLWDESGTEMPPIPGICCPDNWESIISLKTRLSAAAERMKYIKTPPRLPGANAGPRYHHHWVPGMIFSATSSFISSPIFLTHLIAEASRRSVTAVNALPTAATACTINCIRASTGCGGSSSRLQSLMGSAQAVLASTTHCWRWSDTRWTAADASPFSSRMRPVVKKTAAAAEGS
jgi:hypothetical protein